MYNLEILEKGCEELGITLSDTQKNQFIRFYEYLVEKNKVMNLTGITEFDEVLVKHFLDSLCCVKAVDMGKIKTVMDSNLDSSFDGKKPSEKCHHHISQISHKLHDRHHHSGKEL